MLPTININASIKDAITTLRAYVEKSSLPPVRYFQIIEKLDKLRAAPENSTIVGFTAIKDGAGLANDRKANELSTALIELIINYQNWMEKNKKLETVEREVETLHRQDELISREVEKERTYLKAHTGGKYRHLVKEFKSIISNENYVNKFKNIYFWAVQLHTLQNKVRALDHTPKFDLEPNIKENVDPIWTVCDKESEICRAYEAVMRTKYNGKPVIKERKLANIPALYDELSQVKRSLVPLLSGIKYSWKLSKSFDSFFNKIYKKIEIKKEIKELEKLMGQILPEIKPSTESIIRHSGKIKRLKKEVECQTIVKYEIANGVCEAKIFDTNYRKLGTILVSFLTPDQERPSWLATEDFYVKFEFDLKNKNFDIRLPPSIDQVFIGGVKYPTDQHILLDNGGKETYVVSLHFSECKHCHRLGSGKETYVVNLRLP